MNPMNRMFSPRAAIRAFAVGIGPAACVGSLVVHRPKIRCDSIPSNASSLSTSQPRSSRRGLSPETVRQIASGSVTGFGAGVIVALFSRTLALLSGLVALSIYIASRYGWDITRVKGVDKMLKTSSVLATCKGRPWFTVSFFLTFILAAFARL